MTRIAFTVNGIPYALPTGPAREWFALRGWVDHVAIGDTLKKRWLDEIGPRVVR